MNFTLHVWRQEKSSNKGEFKTYEVSNTNATTHARNKKGVLGLKYTRRLSVGRSLPVLADRSPFLSLSFRLVFFSEV